MMAAEGFGDVAEKLRRSTVQVKLANRRAQGSGSGVIWNSDGLVVTNAHVAQTDKVQVELWDGRAFEAEVIKRDTRRDLASMKIPTLGLPAAAPGNSDALRPGELVVAVGNPLGFIGALTTGVVHSAGPLRGLGRQSWVRAAVRLAPGNSGGPLANAQGHVIGVNTMVVSGGLGLAVPSNAIVDFLKQRAPRASLGVTVRPVRSGLLVLEVAPNGAAAQSSIMIGDVLTGADGKPFESVDDLGDALDGAAKGVLSLQFLRGDRRSQREVAVRLFPQGAAA
jgi:serine protease Do